ARLSCEVVTVCRRRRQTASVFLALADFVPHHAADGSAAHSAQYAPVGGRRTGHTAHTRADGRALLPFGHPFPGAAPAYGAAQHQSYKQRVAFHGSKPLSI